LTAGLIAMAAAPAFAMGHGNFGGHQGGQYGGQYGGHQGGGNQGQFGGHQGEGAGNFGQGRRRHQQNHFGVTQLVWTTSPAGGAAGTAETADVTIENSAGKTVDVPAGKEPTLTFGGSGLTASPNGTAASATDTYSDGVYTVTFTPTDAQTGAVLTAAASWLSTATSAAFNVTPGAATLSLSAATAGTASGSNWGGNGGYGGRGFRGRRFRHHQFVFTNSVTVGNITDADGNAIESAADLVQADFAVTSSSGQTLTITSYDTATGVLTFTSKYPETSSDTWTVTYTNTSQITNPSTGVVSATIAG
jgi:hypothetical protein